MTLEECREVYKRIETVAERLRETNDIAVARELIATCEGWRPKLSGKFGNIAGQLHHLVEAARQYIKREGDLEKGSGGLHTGLSRLNMAIGVHERAERLSRDGI